MRDIIIFVFAILLACTAKAQDHSYATNPENISFDSNPQDLIDKIGPGEWYDGKEGYELRYNNIEGQSSRDDNGYYIEYSSSTLFIFDKIETWYGSEYYQLKEWRVKVQHTVSNDPESYFSVYNIMVEKLNDQGFSTVDKTDKDSHGNIFHKLKKGKLQVDLFIGRFSVKPYIKNGKIASLIASYEIVDF